MDIREYSKFIDHSPLKMDATESELIRFCNEAIGYSFHSVVVFPYYIELAKKIIKDSDVKLDTVEGFPFGNELISIKSLQAKEYLDSGTDQFIPQRNSLP
jgi:deoxyribose-phosphate aldolase